MTGDRQDRLIAREYRASEIDLALPQADAGSGQILTPDIVQALIAWCDRYGLDPWAGHVCVLYSKPFVTEKGAAYWASQQTDYDGYDVASVSPEEAVILGFPQGAVVWRCHVFIKGRSHPTTEYGAVTLEEQAEARQRYGAKAQYLPILRSPSHQARARAVRRALSLAFPLAPRAEEPERS